MRDRRPERHAVLDANAVASLLHVTDEREVAGAGTSAPRAMVRNHPVVVLAALVVVIVLAWIVAAPRSAGPDEPGHQVRAGGLVRGQLDGEPYPEFDFQYAYELPGHIGFPDPVCFAFNEFAPASCTNDLEPVDGNIPLGTRAADYPVWGHLPAGLGTFAPAAWSAWAAIRWSGCCSPARGGEVLFWPDLDAAQSLPFCTFCRERACSSPGGCYGEFPGR